MKEKDIIDEEIDSNVPENINGLLEPLVDQKKNKEDKEKKKKNLYKTVAVFNNDNESPRPKNTFLHNSINVNYLNNTNNNPINRIRREINDLKKDNDTEISNYSNTPGTETMKLRNFIFIIILTAITSLQFGIYLFIFNLYMNSVGIPVNYSLISNGVSNQKIFYSFFLILSWKYQIYFIIYLIYATFIYFKMKNNVKKEENKDNYESLNEDVDSIPLISRNNSISSQEKFINSFGNPTFKFREFKYKYLQKYGYSYESYLNIFMLTSNIFNIQGNEGNDTSFFGYYFNFNEILKGLSGIFFAYLILVSSYFYYFGIVYIIQEITALLPYYIEYNKKNNNSNNDGKANENIKENKYKYISKKTFKESNNGEYYKFIFPLLISFGFYLLLKTTINSSLYLIMILICCIGLQMYSQKKFVLNSHNESPFQILFRTYFNYFILSLIIVIPIELIFNKLNFVNIIYWLTNLKLFSACLIGFGLCGAILYNMLIIFMRISLSNNIIVKLIKYLNIIIIDLVGIFLFRQYIITSYLDYIAGLSLCTVSMFLLDFHKIL